MSDQNITTNPTPVKPLSKSQKRALEIAASNPDGFICHQKFVSYQTLIALVNRGDLRWVSYGTWQLTSRTISISVGGAL